MTIKEPIVPTGEDTPTDSQPDKKPEDGTGQSDGGKKPDEPQTKVPFHEDPALQEYLARQLDIREKKLREELETKYNKPVEKASEDKDKVVIPDWFGGDLKQWEAYNADLDKLVISKAEERAVKRIEDRTAAQQKALDEANQHFVDSIKEIESDKTINPDGVKVDRNALLKVVQDYELIDAKGRWNYRAGFAILRKDGAPQNKDRKNLAGGTLDDSGKGEPETKNFKTSEDFKKDRPW